MQVVVAVTGVVSQFPTPLADLLLAGVPEFFTILSRVTGVRTSAIHAFLPNGEFLRRDDAQLRRVGEDARDSGEDSVYVYDFDLLLAEGRNLDVALEEVSLDPPLEAPIKESPFVSLHSPSIYLTPCTTHHSHLVALVSSLHVQHSALTLAASPLVSHIANVASTMEAFTPVVERELDHQQMLLRDHALCMEITTRVNVHTEVRRLRIVPKGKRKVDAETIAGYLNPDAMQTVETACRNIHNDLTTRWESVLESQAQIQQGQEDVRAVTESFIPREADECYNRATQALTRVQELVSSNSDEEPESEEEEATREEVMKELRGLDLLIRSELELMTTLKNQSTVRLVDALRRINIIQSTILTLPSILQKLDEDLRTGGPAASNFGMLARLRRVLYSYGATIVEVVRRKQFARFFLHRSKEMSSIMSYMSSREESRRHTYNREVDGQLPFDVRGMDLPVPRLEITVHGGEEGEWTLEREDVDAVMEMMYELEKMTRPGQDVRTMKWREDADTHPAREARTSLQKMIDKMDEIEDSFDRMAVRSLLSMGWGYQTRQRTISNVSDNKEALEELRELKRVKSEAEEISRKAQDAQNCELQRLRAELVAAQEEVDAHKTRAEKTEAELRSVRALAETDKSVRYTLERRHNELRSDLEYKARQLEQAFEEGTAQTKEIEALRQELHQARTEFERVKTLQEESAEEAARLLRMQADVLKNLEAARLRGDDLQGQIEMARAEGQKASEALADASAEKERLMKSLTAEADRRLRDQRAEADGDRAVLERHYYDLNAKVDRLETELREAKGAADILKADLEDARERLSQAGDTAKDDEDVLSRLREEKERLAEELETLRGRLVGREEMLTQALKAGIAFRDTNARLLPAIKASVVLMKPVQDELASPPEPTPKRQHQSSQRPNDPSDHEAALAALREFDLDDFYRAGQKMFSTLKRWQKHVREYRDRSKSSIAYREFRKGDLALFLPTRNNIAKPWAAFNSNRPHYFLQQTPEIVHNLQGRDWLVARIASIRECVADSKDPASNPYSLTEGLVYHMVEVENQPPEAIPVTRRKTSAAAHVTAAGLVSSIISTDSMMASISAKAPVQESLVTSGPSAIVARPPNPTPERNLLTSSLVHADPFSQPLPSSPDAGVSADQNGISSIRHGPAPAQSIIDASSTTSTIPFEAPQLPIPASTKHTLLTDADIRPATSRSAGSSRGSFSSNRGRPQLFGSPSAASSGNKATATTALIRTSTSIEQADASSRPHTPIAGIEAVRLPPSPTTSSTFASLASNFGATLVGTRRKGSASGKTDVAGAAGAADLLRKFNAP